MRIIAFIAAKNAEGRKLSALLRKEYGVSGSTLTQLRKRPEAVTVNGVPAHLNAPLAAGDEVRIGLPESYAEELAEGSVAPQELGVEYVWLDEDFAAANKPAGMVTHPSRAHVYGTLASDYAYRFPGSVYRPLTRLDCDTSGLVLIARNRHVASMPHSQICRIYLGVTDRPVPGAGGTVDAPIERSAEGSPVRCVRPDGRRAVTHWKKLAELGGLTLIKFELETGRTHQIRVHCAHLGFPLCGDALYGGTETEGLEGQALHAAALGWVNPITGARCSAFASPPAAMAALFPAVQQLTLRDCLPEEAGFFPEIPGHEV